MKPRSHLGEMTRAAPFSDRLRERYLAMAGRIPPAPGCPGADQLWAAAARELPPVDVNRLLDHAASCADCLQDWRLAREVAAGAGVARHSELRAASPVRWALWGSLGAAAAAVVLLAVVVPRSSIAPEAPAWRSDAGAGIELITRSGASLPKNAAILRWSAGPSGTLYTVEVVTEALDLVAAERESPGTSYQIPQEALAPLPPHTRLLWRVEARMPDGSRTGSPTSSIVIE